MEKVLSDPISTHVPTLLEEMRATSIGRRKAKEEQAKLNLKRLGTCPYQPGSSQLKDVMEQIKQALLTHCDEERLCLNMGSLNFGVGEVKHWPPHVASVGWATYLAHAKRCTDAIMAEFATLHPDVSFKQGGTMVTFHWTI